MKDITTRQFRLLTDCDMIWQLMTENYEPLFANGAPAPFFEYYINNADFKAAYMSKCRIWLDSGRAVGFVYYEGDVSSIHFILRRGYDELAPEMVHYADEEMYGKDKTFTFMDGQTALMKAASDIGYAKQYTETDNMIDLSRADLDYPLPAGYRFIKPETVDTLKMTKCLWSGFNNGEIAPDFAPGPETDDDPAVRLYLTVDGDTLAPPPHSTYWHNIIIADENGDYVCFSGMWWVEKNKLAYMEPLCTVPAHRRKGLAAAALSEHCRRMRALGAEYMTGGGNEFYRSIGYNCEINWHKWKKCDL
ncbi:MAG: GNAT family N-acetyltransferase [Oscillospiraceae bacterium]|nr:GNAT family N-acetyltransferase [Oscillospiraceae bacterium]